MGWVGIVSTFAFGGCNIVSFLEARPRRHRGVEDTPARQLADAVCRVHAGLRVVDPSLAADSLAVGEPPLTTRGTEVLRAARNGGSISDIAAAFFLSEGTVPAPVRGDRRDGCAQPCRRRAHR